MLGCGFLSGSDRSRGALAGLFRFDLSPGNAAGFRTVSGRCGIGGRQEAGQLLKKLQTARACGPEPRLSGRRTQRMEFMRMLAFTSAMARMRFISTSLSAWWGFWLTSLT